MTADLIVFGEDWGRHPSSTQHLVKRLAADRRVVWVNSIGLRRPRLGFADLKRIVQKLRAALFGRSGGPVEREPVPPNLSVVAPLALPWPGNPLAAWLNRRLVGRQVRRVMAARGIVRPVLWASLPTVVDLMGAFGERATLYYCGDDFAHLAGVDHGPVTRAETRLAAKADRILAASPALAARFPTAKTLMLPHGADIALFAAPAPRAPDLPEGPVAGFYGSLSAWLDQALLAEAARRLPGWTFLVIGEVRVPVERLTSVPNVRLIGPRPHSALPGYCQHWQVSLLPFIDNAQIRASNPLKLREYLATGQPIVSTPFPALDAYADLISIAPDAAGFVAAIEQSLHEPDARRAERRDRVRSETWEARAAQVATLIDGLS
ncbi:MAG: putative glycosyltransferase [Rhodospirillales bacterium]|nr:putative glycosyltransferase [Rhodospirillales bacterium]